MFEGGSKRLLWWLLIASRGGQTRARILQTIRVKPSNANQLAEDLHLDYSTVKHHLGILVKNKIIDALGEKYSVTYFVSDRIRPEDLGEFLEKSWKR